MKYSVKKYSVKIYERQECMYRYDIEAVDETTASNIAIQMFNDGEQSDDYAIIQTDTHDDVEVELLEENP